jgi:hypothetical protein
LPDKPLNKNFEVIARARWDGWSTLTPRLDRADYLLYALGATKIELRPPCAD